MLGQGHGIAQISVRFAAGTPFEILPPFKCNIFVRKSFLKPLVITLFILLHIGIYYELVTARKEQEQIDNLIRYSQILEADNANLQEEVDFWKNEFFKQNNQTM